MTGKIRKELGKKPKAPKAPEFISKGSSSSDSQTIESKRGRATALKAVGRSTLLNQSQGGRSTLG